MANSFMADIGSLGATSITAKKSTSREGNTEMKMEDFLTLMVVQLQNQTIDDTADTGEMLNQLVQMQMVTALSNMTDASIMSYASSLVGKEVTIGVVNGDNELEEKVLNVIGTGLYDGQQVIFCDDGNMYQLSQIMAVGRLPEEDKPEEPEVDKEQDELEKEANARIDQLVSDIRNGNITADNAGGKTDAGSAGAVDAVNTDNNAENSAETEAETGTGSGNADPLKGGLLDGMLVNPNPADESYTGEQGAPTDET